MYNGQCRKYITEPMEVQVRESMLALMPGYRGLAKDYWMAYRDKA